MLLIWARYVYFGYWSGWFVYCENETLAQLASYSLIGVYGLYEEEICIAFDVADKTKQLPVYCKFDSN